MLKSQVIVWFLLSASFNFETEYEAMVMSFKEI